MISRAVRFVDMKIPAAMPSSHAGMAFGSASRFSRARASCSSRASGFAIATSIKKFRFCTSTLLRVLAVGGFATPNV